MYTDLAAGAVLVRTATVVFGRQWPARSDAEDILAPPCTTTTDRSVNRLVRAGRKSVKPSKSDMFLISSVALNQSSISVVNWVNFKIGWELQKW